jgi:hypothetical protein
MSIEDVKVLVDEARREAEDPKFKVCNVYNKHFRPRTRSYLSRMCADGIKAYIPL